MIETLVKPKSLDNDVAVIKIMQLMGQLTLSDIDYVLQITQKIYGEVNQQDESFDRTASHMAEEYVSHQVCTS